METILAAFLITTAFAVLLNLVFKRFGIPTIIGYIVTGTLISSALDFSSNEEITHLAEFGIVFLMFTIGLEFSFKHLIQMRREVFVNGTLQFILCGALLSVLIYYSLNLNSNTSLIVGLALALSSTAIVLKTLNDNGEITQTYGRKALGILLFQDIAVIPILLMIDLFSSKDTSVNELLIQTLISASILIVLLYVIGKYVINWIFYKVIRTNSQEIFIATVLFMVVGASSLAHFFGFSYSLGAFLAGMLMAETEYKHQIEADLIPFRDLLLGLFFITVGMQINLEIVISNLFMIILLFISSVVIKAIIIFAILITYQSVRIATKTSLAICQVGEFALAIFALLTTRGFLPTDLAQILIAVSVISMFATPFILKNLNNIANLINEEKITPKDEYIKPQKIKNHIVIFGYGKLGQEVVLRLKEQNLLYLVLENDINLVELGKSRGENVFLGNATQQSTFDNACVNTAAAIIVTVSNEQRLEIIAQSIAHYAPDVQTVLRFSGNDEKVLFSDLGTNFHMVREERAIARILVQEALHCKMQKDLI